MALSIGALLAAGVAAYAAGDGRRPTPVGIAVCLATPETLVLVVALLRTRGPGESVRIDRGVLHVAVAVAGPWPRLVVLVLSDPPTGDTHVPGPAGASHLRRRPAR